jgi:hypothetical protein
LRTGLLARDAETVLFDTSPLVNLGQTGLLFPVAGYIGLRGAISRDVHNEIVRNLDRFPDLRALSMLRWPPGEPLDLPVHLLADAEGIRRVNAEPGDHEDRNRGEIATALIAHDRGDTLVVMEDRLGKRLCQLRSLPRLSTAQLIAEMVAFEAVGEEEGLRTFEHATPAGVGRPEFLRAVQRCR